jgi:Ca2+/H+ antiporter, TMEM165/GDT1 family
METFLTSAGLVAIAEIGDKTQLLALMLAARFRAPVPIILGILTATVANHALAALAGNYVAGMFDPEVLRWALTVSFLAMAAWALVPDKADDEPTAVSRAGAFVATTIAFFLVEIGDKTQIATVALGAKFQDVLLVTAGTTAGMMIADVPAVFMGDLAAEKLPLKLIRGVAAALFAALGMAVFFGAGRVLAG